LDSIHDGFFCLPPDQKIICEDKIKNISEIGIGDKVLTHKNRFREVKKTYIRDYEGELIRIRTKKFNLDMKTTPEHPILVAIPKIKRNEKYIKYHNTRDWEEKEDIELLNKKIHSIPLSIDKRTRRATISRLFRMKKYFDIKYDYEWKRAEDVTENDLMVYPIIKEIQENRKFMNDDLCYLLGLFLADGSCQFKGGYVKFFVERELVEKVKNKIISVFGIEPKIYQRKRSENDCCEIVIFSRKIVKDFEVFGKRKDKKPPIEILTLPLKYQKSFLSGYFDGDGFESESGVTSSITISPNIEFFISQLLLRQDIIPSITSTKSIKYNYMITFCKCFYLSGIINEDKLLLPIKSIEKERYSGKVHNLEVEEDNSYSLLNSIVHNCGDEFWLQLDSRASVSKKNKIVSDILLKSRKRSLTFCMTAQILDLLDKRIRKVLDFSAYPMLNNNESICKLVIFRGGYLKNSSYMKTIYFRTPFFFDCFDTTEEIVINDYEEVTIPKIIFQESKDSEPEYFQTFEEADARAMIYYEQNWPFVKQALGI
jgi:intein/homing endonuclease